MLANGRSPMSFKIPPPVPSYAEPRPAVGRIMLFVVALGLSIGLHAWLWRELPAMPVGRMVLAERPRHISAEPMRLGEVQPTPPESPYVQPTRFRPENPDAFAAVAERQDDLLGEFLSAEANRPYAAPDPAPPAPSADAIPPAAFPPSPEHFRQEILQIEQRLASDELAALPRRLTPRTDRVQGAPDLTFSASSELVSAAAAAAVGPGDPSAIVPLPPVDEVVPPPLAPQDAAVLASLPTSDAAAAFAADLDALTIEPSATVSEATPIEDKLALATTAWADSTEGYLYFQVQILRSGEQALPVLPKDVLLVQDCSESITRSKLDYFKEALEAYLRTLTTADRFNIMAYSESSELCFPDWAPATPDTLTSGLRFVRSLRLRGKTDLFSCLQQVLHLTRDASRPLIVLLFTDGRPTMGLMDNSDIITRFSRLNSGRVSVFTVGAGDNVNAFLLDMLGQDNRGGTYAAADRASLPNLANTASRELARPCLMDLSYRLSGDLRAEVYPAALTHLYVDRPLTLVGRAPLDAATGVLQVLGSAGGKPFDMVFPIDVRTANRGTEQLRRDWARQKIYDILNKSLDARSPEAEAQARALAAQYHVPLGW